MGTYTMGTSTIEPTMSNQELQEISEEKFRLCIDKLMDEGHLSSSRDYDNYRQATGYLLENAVDEGVAEENLYDHVEKICELCNEFADDMHENGMLLALQDDFLLKWEDLMLELYRGCRS